MRYRRLQLGHGFMLTFGLSTLAVLLIVIGAYGYHENHRSSSVIAVSASPANSIFAHSSPSPNPSPSATPTPVPSSKATAKPTTPRPTTVTPSQHRYGSTAAAADLAVAGTITAAAQALQAFGSQYGLDVEVTSVSPSSYVSSYDNYVVLGSGDLAALKSYGSAFIDEWSKYPNDWINSSGLKHVVFVKAFAVGVGLRAAGPDPAGLAMYYDVGYGNGSYAREVIHHEFDHFIEYHDYGSYAHSDPTWLSYNPAGFSYGNGGASCYQPGNNCLTGQHPIPGFVTGYAASAIEEDKAELYAYLMTGTYYHQLVGWLASDSNLTHKVTAYKNFISTHSPEMSGSYFTTINP